MLLIYFGIEMETFRGICKKRIMEAKLSLKWSHLKLSAKRQFTVIFPSEHKQSMMLIPVLQGFLHLISTCVCTYIYTYIHMLYTRVHTYEGQGARMHALAVSARTAKRITANVIYCPGKGKII